MIGLLLMVYAIYHCKRYGEDKEKIHAEVKVLHDKGLLRVLKESFFALLSPVIILAVSTAVLLLRRKQRLFLYFMH